VLKGIKRSKNPLRRFIRDKKNDCEDKRVIKLLNDVFFWRDLDELMLLLEPLHEAQIMSESSKGHLNQVKRRWDDIRTHLAAHEHASELLDLFDVRREKQTSAVHYLAWHLDPRNRAAKHRDYGDLAIVFDFFKEHYSPSDYTTLKAEYVKYKGMKNEFSTPSLWEEDTIADFDMFWAIASDFSPLLANLADRLRTTPPNSVPSERAFSALKL
jgi:hypothetical protein